MRADLDLLAQDREIIVVAGPGGVGKTTTAAALALSGARHGRRVVVITVDPARRLADALGIDHDADHPVEVWVGEGGSLWAVMLDAEATFDRVITEQARDRRQAEALLTNPIYRGIAGSLGGAQEYMAIERLHQLHDTGGFDLIVVDTPPSRQAVDLLSAPDRLVRFLNNPVYRTLTAPGRGLARVTHAASSAFEWTVRRLAGPQVVEDTLAFFRALTGMEDGFARRAAEVDALLRHPGTSFVVVTSPRSEALDEAEHLADELDRRGLGVEAVVVNLIHPQLAELSERTRTEGPAGHLATHRFVEELARAERELVAERLGVRAVAELPLLDHDVTDLDGLERLSRCW